MLLLWKCTTHTLKAAGAYRRMDPSFGTRRSRGSVLLKTYSEVGVGPARSPRWANQAHHSIMRSIRPFQYYLKNKSAPIKLIKLFVLRYHKGQRHPIHWQFTQPLKTFFPWPFLDLLAPPTCFRLFPDGETSPADAV